MNNPAMNRPGFPVFQVAEEEDSQNRHKYEYLFHLAPSPQASQYSPAGGPTVVYHKKL